MNLWKNITALVLGAWIVTAAGADERYKLIAHPSVPVTSMSANDASLLFLKKITSYTKWGSAQKSVPFDLHPDSDTREAFSQSVHKKAVAAIKAYWQHQIFSGRGTPPTELSSDAEVLAAVARTPGAIGYVSSGASVPDGVKLLKVQG